MNEELKSCPFCGGKVKVNATNVSEQIYCPNCGASTVWCSFSLSRERWNKRTRRETRLKPCPICGGKAKIYSAYDGSFCIQCPDCTLTSKYSKDKNAVIEHWNRRIDNA